MGFVTGMVAGLQRHALDPAPLLAGLDIDPADPARRVPLDRYATLYNRVITELDDEGFGLFAQRMPPGSFEFLCRGMLGAPSLAEGLDRARRSLRSIAPKFPGFRTSFIPGTKSAPGRSTAWDSSARTTDAAS